MWNHQCIHFLPNLSFYAYNHSQNNGVVFRRFGFSMRDSADVHTVRKSRL